MKICKERCWLTEDGKGLVEDGDEKASRLFAVEGSSIAEDRLEGIKGADKFFKDLNSPEKKEEHSNHPSPSHHKKK